MEITKKDTCQSAPENDRSSFLQSKETPREISYQIVCSQRGAFRIFKGFRMGRRSGRGVVHSYTDKRGEREGRVREKNPKHFLKASDAREMQHATDANTLTSSE
jgi:hypothetical protein